MANVIDGNADGALYLYGTDGHDIFTFSEGHGPRDHVYGFNARQGDIIDLSGFEQNITWDDLKENITQVQDPIKGGWCLQIDLTEWGGGVIYLHGLGADGYYLGDPGMGGEPTESLFKLSSPSPNAEFGSNDSETLVGDDTDNVIYGRGGDDVVSGRGGDDTLFGGAGDDYIIGGAGDDTLFGGAGDDEFIRYNGDGHDVIKDFGDGDIINLMWVGVTGLSDLNMTQDGDNVVIDLSDHGGGSITLSDTDLDDLDENSFAFADDTDGM